VAKFKEIFLSVKFDTYRYPLTTLCQPIKIVEKGSCGTWIILSKVQDISPVIMRPTELKMQPTIQAGYGGGQSPGLLCKCIVGCIFNSVGLIITCIYQMSTS
jgi:hypothetical protein